MTESRGRKIVHCVTLALVFGMCGTIYAFQEKSDSAVVRADSGATRAPDSSRAGVPKDTMASRFREVTQAQMDTLRTLQNNAFAAGETLSFSVKYGFLTAGDAIIATSDTTMGNGREAYKVAFNVDSKPVFNWIFKVTDRYSTYIDKQGLFPWRFEQHIREGGYSRDFVAQFDQVNHEAITTEKNYRIPPYVHDIMSAFFYSRTIDYKDFKVGQRIHLQNFFKDSTYELDVKFKGRQRVEVEAGTFDCVIVEPLAREGGLFKSDGSVYIWLTDDERKIPVKVSTKIAIGSIDSELTGFTGIKGVIKAKIEN
jgi:hypothetical protein